MKRKSILGVVLVAVMLVGACAPAAPSPTAAPAKPAATTATTAPAAPAATTAPAAAAKPTTAPAATIPLPTETSPVGDGADFGKLGDAYPRPAKPAKAYKIGIAIANVASGGTHFAGQLYGYTDEAKALGATLNWVDAGGYANVAKQIEQLEDLAANKPDAIIIVATNGPRTKKAVDDIVDVRKIPVANVNVLTDSEKVFTRIRSDDEVLGRLEGEYLVKKVGTKETNVVMMPGSPGTSWAVGRSKGFREVVKSSPNIKILAEQWVENTVPNGLELAEDYLQTFPKIDAVFCGSDTQCIGMAQALKAAGKDKQGIILVTADFQPDGQKLLAEGAVEYASIQTPVIMGRWGIRAVINYLEGKTVPKALYTPIGKGTKDNALKIDPSGVRAPDGWKP